MSLLAHLARATLAPEAALRPALPQAFANWQAGAPADEDGWGEEVASAEAARPAPARIAPSDDPFAAPGQVSDPEPAPREAHSAPPARSPFAELPEVEPAPPPQPARSGRGIEPVAEAKRPAPAPQPQAVDPRPALIAESPEPRRRGQESAPAEPAVPPVVQAPVAQPVSVPVPPVAVPSPEPASPRAVAPVVVAPPVQPERPARHDEPAPQRADRGTLQPETRATPPRLEEPRVLREVIRERALAPEASGATPLAVPAVAQQAVAAPVLAAPMVIPPEAVEAAAPRLPDVHISIGRVEVRAAAAPPRPAAREAGAKPAPLSLDAYLNRRGGGAR